MRKNLALAVALVACGAPSEPRTVETRPPPPAAAETVLGPFPVDVATTAQRVFIHPTSDTGNAAAVIATTNTLHGPDRFERYLPACVELAAGTDSFTVSSNAARFAVFVTYERDSSFDADACARASLPR